MARIREYTQQTSVGGEVGGRRATAEDFGFGRELQGFGETMLSVGTYIKQDQERKEVDDAQVKLAESRQQWTETYLKREQEMVPGDTTLAPTIRDEMKGYFDSMAEGYSSRAAKKYVQMHGATMATGFFTQGLQHQSQMAGRKALEDIGNRKAADGNTAYMNPQLYEMVKSTYLFDSANGVGTAHSRLKNDPRKETIDRDYVQNLAWQAGQGALKNPAMRGFIVGNIEGSETQTTANLFQTLMPSIFKTEGGYVGNDGKRGPTNYGINAQANGLTPEQVKSLTPDQAQQIYKNNYWDRYQLETLPAAVIPVVFDGVINHRTAFAQTLVDAAKMGATPQQLADMRKAEYTRLITSEPDSFKKYEKSWMGRVDRAAAESAKLATQQTAPLTVDESKLPVWYSDMSPEGKDRFLREALALTKQERAVSDQALSRTMQDHQAELAIYGGKLKSQPLPQSAFIGKPLEWQKYRSMIEAGEKVQTVANAPESEQAQLLERLKPQTSPIPGVFDYQADLYVNAVKVVEASNKRRREDPMAFATSAGFSIDNPIKPIDTSDPQKLAEQLIVRDPQASAISKSYGSKFQMLTKPEATFLRESFDQMDTKRQSEWIGTVRGALPPEKFRAVIEQVANGDKALLGAGLVASSQYGGDTRDMDADSIIVGRNILTRTLKGGGNDQERAFKAAGLPSAGDAYKVAAGQLKGLVGVPEAQKEAIIETAMAHYIGKTTKANSFAVLDLAGPDTTSNQKSFLESVKAIAPISKVGVSTVLRPYGMSDDQFQERVDANVRVKFAGSAKADGFSLERGSYSLMMSGGGYQLVVGGRAVGEPFKLDALGTYSNEGYGKGVTIGYEHRKSVTGLPPQFKGVQTYQERTGKGFYQGWSEANQ